MYKTLPIILLLGIVVVSAVAKGQTPVVPKGVSGYTVTVQDDWVRSDQGFYPVRVTVETNPPATVVDDTLFTVSINERNYQYASGVVSAPLRIPAGQKSGTVELYVFAGNSQNTYSNDLLVERGEYDGQLNRRDLLKTSFSFQGGYGMEPTVLFVSSGFSKTKKLSWVCYRDQMKPSASSRTVFVSDDPIPRIDELCSIYLDTDLAPNIGNRNQNKGAIPATPPEVVITNNERIHGIHPNSLPKNWIGLSSVEQVLISMSDFKMICLKQEADRARIEQWVVAGGVLIIFDTGPGFQEADKIWPFLLGPDRTPAGDQRSKWMVPDSKTQALTRLVPRSGSRSQYYYDQNQAIWYGSDGREAEMMDLGTNKWHSFANPSSIPIPGQQENKNKNSKSTQLASKFGISTYVNGHIVAINDDLSAWNADDWRGLENAIVAAGHEMHSQIGASTGLVELPGFDIPGVGEPPIRTFQVLIGLFLLLAGPVMLLVLKRTEQMQYLFVAVPLLSLVVCFSLFMYAVLVDGSHRWGRTQTVTAMDHRTNMSVTHSRSNYYSGAHPGRYDFPENAMSIVVREEISNPLFDRFEAGRQQTWGGNIRPRMPHEVVSIRSQMARQRLILEQGATKEDLPAIKNQLGVDVALVLFRTENGIFMVEDIKADETMAASKISDPIAKNKSGAQIRRLAPYLDRGIFGGGRRRSYGLVATGEINGWGEDARVIELLRSNRVSELLTDPNTYVAIMEQFPLAAEQIEPVEYKLQAHVVRGQW